MYLNSLLDFLFPGNTFTQGQEYWDAKRKAQGRNVARENY